MRKTRKIRLAALLCACSIALSALSGCSGGEEKAAIRPEARNIANEYYAGDLNSFAAWKDIDRNKVIASVNTPEHLEYFDITFGDFIGEYMYYLILYGITDDMSEDNADSCKSYRVNIINYLMFEKMYLYTAETEYGISADTLTPEQLEEVRNTAIAVKDDWAMNFYDSACEVLGDDADYVEIDTLCNEVLDVILEKCGVDSDMFYQWELGSLIEDLLTEAMNNKIEVTEEQVQEVLDALITEAKYYYLNDPETYESTPSYTAAYLPEGTRKADHILLRFDNDTIAEITAAYESGDDAKAEELIAAAYTEELQKKAEDIIAEADSGTPFAELIEKYGGDSSASDVMVLDNSPTFEPAFVRALYDISEKGGISEPVLSRNGVYIIRYADDAAITEEESNNLRESLRAYLKSTAEANTGLNEYDNWINKYKYDIDCETLMIDPEDTLQYSQSGQNGITEGEE